MHGRPITFWGLIHQATRSIVIIVGVGIVTDLVGREVGIVVAVDVDDFEQLRPAAG